jgi:predicted GIY-YIG superfamily endonuclease
MKSKAKNKTTDSRQKISKSKKNFFVYLLACSDNTLYCGSTSDLSKRLHAHNHLKSAAKYTRSRRPVTLVYSEQLKTFAKMRAREAEIKRKTRVGKLRLL